MSATKPRPIDRMNAEWAGLGRCPDARRAVLALSRAEPIVARLHVTDLRQLVERLRTGPERADREHAARVIQAMLRSSAVHPLVPRALLQAMVPGLVTVARRLSWGTGGEWTDGGSFFTDTLTTAWEIITEWAGQDRPYAALDLLSAVRCRLRRQVERHRAGLERISPCAIDDEHAHVCGLMPRSDLEVLANALDDLRGRGLDPADAAVVYGHLVLGLSLSELSELSGHSARQLRQRHHRAVHAICCG
jgi:hypothetical protein